MVGNFYDNALAEKVTGPYKNELIHTWPWDTAPQSRLKNVAAPHVSTFPGGGTQVSLEVYDANKP